MTPYFLQNDFIIRFSQLAGFAEGAAAELIDCATAIAADAELSAFAERECYNLYQLQPSPISYAIDFPLIEARLSDKADLFTALVAMSGLPQMQELYLRRGIPERYLKLTLRDFSIWMNDHKKRFGNFGLSRPNAYWQVSQLLLRAVRIGRLQFQPNEYSALAPAFSNIRTGRVLCLAAGGQRYRADGCLDGTDDVFDEQGAWESRFEETAQAFIGSPVRPWGQALNKTVTLQKSEWAPLLSAGDPMLGLHIPEDGPMDFDLCGQAMREALEFFPKYFPEHKFKGFTCGSWLLGPYLQGILSPATNILRFQDMFYLYPIKASHHETFNRVFGDPHQDISTAPRKSSLQRALADHMLAGGHAFPGAGFFLKRDARAWGQTSYQRAEREAPIV